MPSATYVVNARGRQGGGRTTDTVVWRLLALAWQFMSFLALVRARGRPRGRAAS